MFSQKQILYEFDFTRAIKLLATVLSERYKYAFPYTAHLLSYVLSLLSTSIPASC